MSTINGYLMNNSIINTNIIDTNLHNQSHTGFIFYGNGILDSIYISKLDDDILKFLDYIIETTFLGVLPEWTPNTKFLASMNHNVDGSNIFGLVDSPTTWILYRKEINADIMIKVAEFPINVNNWTDYKCEGNKEYCYYLFAKNSTQISEPIITDTIKTSFYGYYLLSSDVDSYDEYINQNVETYLFDLNSTSDKVSINNSSTTIDNYTKYPVVVIGNKNYRSGSFTSLLIPKYNGKYDFQGKRNWANYLNSLQTFLHNKNYKYFKDKTGQVIKVITESNNETFSYQLQAYDIKGQQVISVTIPWIEIGDINDTTTI